MLSGSLWWNSFIRKLLPAAWVISVYLSWRFSVIFRDLDSTFCIFLLLLLSARQKLVYLIVHIDMSGASQWRTAL